MEEELNENDLEERLYAMIHHVDGTQDENTEPSENVPRVEEAPRSTVRRYWRTSHNSAYQKVNTPKDAPTNKTTPANVNKNTPAHVNKNTPAPINRNHAAATITTDPKPKEEKNAPNSPASTALAVLQCTAPQNFVKTVEILEIDEVPNVFELESSDEDEVIEVALPPKPTITIESSDEDELIAQNDKANSKASKKNKSPNKNNRDVSASPVPSVVSSMSDEFIRGDCIALNISSAQPDNHFDFSLHGSDLLGDGTPSKKKKKKKSKDRVTSTPIAEATQEPQTIDNIFATPKSKAKNKKTKTKSYAVSEKIIPNADVYDSDSNQSVIDITKNHDAYIVTEKSFPSADVYESDSSVADCIRDPVSNRKQPAQLSKSNDNDSSDNNMCMKLTDITPPKNVTDKTVVVDLTNDFVTLDETHIVENIVMGNVSGYSDVHEYGDSSLIDTATAPKELGRFCSTKVPQILYEDLDFDNLKGKDKVCKRRRYSLTTLRAEMEKFYNESWGGENFNHQEIQKNMSRDKSLWVIDPKDRMPNPPKRRVTCNYCNRVGHRDDTCRLKPPVCYMCGHTGHYEPRCPRKICVNCGSPNFMYSTMCRNCSSWRQLQCAECGQPGHPASHCPDTWRRYHNTIDENMPLERCPGKPQYQLQCSGCARRGHLAHACRSFMPLCSLPVNSPRVARYWCLYPPTRPDSTPLTPATPPRTDKKRPSKSPAHETHVNKKRTSESEGRTEKQRNSQSNSNLKVANVDRALEAPDFIPVGSNHNNQGQIIQDNEVSDTSEVRTSARIYLSDDLVGRLRTPAGQDWMLQSMKAYNIDVCIDDTGSFLTVIGTVGNQGAFHTHLRTWQADAENDKTAEPQNQEDNNRIMHMMPKKRKDVLRKLHSAFESLKKDIGDPKVIYKELTYLQNRHETIKSMRIISPKQLNNNRNHINEMLKKLNMVLLGQAGLAGGAERLNALHSLQEKVTNIRNQNVPLTLRSEISEHYQSIFTSIPRVDYKDLVQKFYSKQTGEFVKRNHQQIGTKKRNKKLKSTLKPLKLNPWIMSATAEDVPTTVQFKEQAPGKPNRIKKLLEQLTCFHSLLLEQRTSGDYNQKLNIANKVHTEITSLKESEGQPKKERLEKVKKALKIQWQARHFLQKAELKEKNSCKKQKQKQMLS